MQGSSPSWLCWTSSAHLDTYGSIFKTTCTVFNSPRLLLGTSLHNFTSPSAYGLKSGSVRLLFPSFGPLPSRDPLSVRSFLRFVGAVICSCRLIFCWGRSLRLIGPLRADRRSRVRFLPRGLGFFSSAAGIGFLFRWFWTLGRCFLDWFGWWSGYTSLNCLPSLEGSQRFCLITATKVPNFPWAVFLSLWI